MSESPYRICSRCVMDTSDPEIRFDAEGVCCHCTASRNILENLPPIEQRESELARVVEEIRRSGVGKPYDCVVGVSGGVDSTYAMYQASRLGLRLLAIHLDNGWNSELAVSNIEKAVKTLNIPLETVVLDWEEFRDLQLSFLKASVTDAEIPTDHAITAAVYDIAHRLKIDFIISGTNLSTENILPDSWTHGIIDWRYIRSVHSRFGSKRLRTFPHLGLGKRFYYRTIGRMKSVPVLNYLVYDKRAAVRTLQNELGWRSYGEKHHESTYTKFFQCYILPRKFGIDKRRAHLSSLICSGQTTREDAVRELQKPPCPEDELGNDKRYVLKKLGLTEAEFDSIMALPKRSYKEFPTSDAFFRAVEPLGRIGQALGIIPRKNWM